MRKIKISNLPNTTSIRDESTLAYARLLNLEIERFNRDLNKYISKVVVSSLTATATLTANNELVLCDGTFTVTLPPAGSSEGKVYYIKNTGSGTITIDAREDETIDGETSQSLDAQYEFITTVSDGTEWWIINSNL